MKTGDVIIGGIAATTAFTLFSYAASKVFNEKFEEPELLGEMIDRVAPAMDNEQSQLAGWATHYVVGIGMAKMYKQMIEITGVAPSLRNGLIIGAITGYPASLIWDTTLKMYPAPPRKRSLSYYLQLAAGHAVFGGVVLGLFNFLNKRRLSRTIPEVNQVTLS